MKRALVATALAAVLLLGRPAWAHRLDEYLQATLLSLEPDRVQASMRLIPGVAVAPAVIAAIDTDRDGVFSAAEQTIYAQRVLADLALTADGRRLTPKLLAVTFPQTNEMREGLGEIHLEFAASLPHTAGPTRRLTLENHHAPQRSVYLVNCLVPSDRALGITAQNRNRDQSFYELTYTQSGLYPTPARSALGPIREILQTLRAAFAAAGFSSLFRLGMHHIAEGTDHLLFLFTLLLPAPLLAAPARWAGPAATRSALGRTLRVVTAFTLGHSLTLALAALGLVSVPSRPIEVLIAISILVSAIHALRPLFPGREAIIAALFGLVHGLAFAATLSHWGLGWWPRVGGLLAFNLGIETMQLLLVAILLPSLLLLSRTRAYPWLRLPGALLAAAAATGWLVERLFGLPSATDRLVNTLAAQAPWLAGTLFLLSLASWLWRKRLSAVPA